MLSTIVEASNCFAEVIRPFDSAKSAWIKLLASNEDVAFNLTSGFHFRAFHSLCGVLYTNMDVERERNRTRSASETSLVVYTWVYVGSTMSQT